jgi:hypothetical protein
MKTKTGLILIWVGILALVLFVFFELFVLSWSHSPTFSEPPPTTVEPPGSQYSYKPLPPSPEYKPFLLIDRILESMGWGNIAFNAPSSMNLRDLAQIQLLLSLEQSVEELRDMVTAAGEKEGARIRVSNWMEARLSGLSFQIQ